MKLNFLVSIFLLTFVAAFAALPALEARAQGEGGDAGVGNTSATTVTLGYDEFRNALRTRSYREAREYIAALRNREDSENIRIVISGFPGVGNRELLRMADADPGATATLLRDLAGANDTAAREAILRAAKERAHSQVNRDIATINRERSRHNIIPETMRIRHGRTLYLFQGLSYWLRHPEEGTLEADRVEN